MIETCEFDTNRKNAFTLIEVSISLVVIGLLVGGVLMAKDMIRTAEIRGVLSDVEKYNLAVLTFQDKYEYLPGDLPNATAYWGSIWGNSSDNFTASCTANSDNGTISGKATCNGNGDNMISGGAGCTNKSFAVSLCGSEVFMTWQHLANAGLISGVFVPSRKGHSSLSYRSDWVGGTGGNSPSARHNPKELFTIWHLCRFTNTIFPEVCGTYMLYGGQKPPPTMGNANDTPMWPAFTSNEAKAIDDKLDDGFPGTGSVLTLRGGAPYVGGTSCATTGVASTALYHVSDDIKCGLMFKTPY